MQNKRSPSIRKSDIFSIRVFYPETSYVIMFDYNQQKSRCLTDQNLISDSTHDIEHTHYDISGDWSHYSGDFPLRRLSYEIIKHFGNLVGNLTDTIVQE